MLLCDIGNTSYTFFDEGTIKRYDVASFEPHTLTQEIYYICVNEKIKNLIETFEHWHDLEPYIVRENYYETMGIDRIMACEGVDHALIIDAGSALTVDIVKHGIYCGGYIYPGKKAIEACYENISPALAYSINFELELDKMPKNSQDAISYGYIKTLQSEVEKHNLPVVMTGGDAKLWKHIFCDASLHENLIFQGMKNIIKKVKRC